jgi:sulfur carrier protein
MAIAIHLNGERYTIEGDAALDALLDKLGARRSRIAVEINNEIVPKAEYTRTMLKDGDNVEVINFVGGGI